MSDINRPGVGTVSGIIWPGVGTVSDINRPGVGTVSGIIWPGVGTVSDRNRPGLLGYFKWGPV